MSAGEVIEALHDLKEIMKVMVEVQQRTLEEVGKTNVMPFSTHASESSTVVRLKREEGRRSLMVSSALIYV
jgi:hypothetical protein